MTVILEGQTLSFLPERALFWQEQKILIFSDVHLGKAESLRAEGIAIPVESGASDLRRLDKLIAQTHPAEIYILGDFIHHPKSWTTDLEEELHRFFDQHLDIRWNLILGNHERGSLPYLERLPLIICNDDLRRKPFIFTHGHHENFTEGFQISGHIHPVITLREGPLKMRCPCFVISKKGLLLPSFGTWTGGAEVTPEFAHRYFIIAGQEVFEAEIPVRGHLR